jgi:hypothetical protein
VTSGTAQELVDLARVEDLLPLGALDRLDDAL